MYSLKHNVCFSAYRNLDWNNVRREGHNLFTKLIRTRNPRDIEGPEIPAPGTQRLSVSKIKAILKYGIIIFYVFF